MANEIGEFGFTHKNELVGAGPELPIRYTVPYEWGTLRVSEGADEFYGFVPLTAETTPGDSNELAATSEVAKQRVDIFLMSPDELVRITDEHRDSEVDFRGGLGVMRETHKNGVAIGLALTNNAESVRRELRFIAEMSGGNPEIDALDSQELGHTLTQAQIHALSVVMGAIVSESMTDYLQNQTRKTAVRRSTAGTILTGGVLLGLAGMDTAIEAYGDLSPFSVGYLGALATFYLALSRVTFKRYVNNQPVYDSIAAVTAARTGVDVANSVHRTFCSHLFDAAWQNEDPER